MRPALVILLVLSACVAAEETVWLSDLDLSKVSQGWGKAQINKSITEKPITIAGRKFERGVGTHADSTLWIDLGGGAEKFFASVGVDDSAAGKPGSVVFEIIGDGAPLWSSGVMKPGQPAKAVDVDLKGVKRLLLRVDDAGDGIDFDHADWAEARFVVSGAKPKAVDAPPVPRETPVVLTPPAPAEPRLNGPKRYGCRPGKPFLYRIPCTGERPLTFAAEGLPASLALDAKNGLITGAAPAVPGDYKVMLKASNARGAAQRLFTLVAGDTLALTPPMGWNDWYTFYDRPTDKLMREAADTIVQFGLADVGYQYVNLDDCWMNKPNVRESDFQAPPRDAAGKINANKRFPDMKALTAYIHGKGLKAGLYTSPGPQTCAGFVGSYQHEELDAQRFAEWGFDFLKHDWCSYGSVEKGSGLEYFKKPYKLMGDILKKQDRDIVYNLCQYGMGEVWKWGGEVGAQCWRTTGDLGLEKAARLPGFYKIGFSNARHYEYAQPGQWNDPDYILIGYVGNAHNMNEPSKPTPLTPSEQYSYMSMWCLMAAPLFYSGDIYRLDEFTLNVLCNTEVIEVDQDVLGKQGKPLVQTAREFVLAKPLEDGSLAVGLFNLAETEQPLAATWEVLGLSGKQRVRDLWRQKDVGECEGRFETKVARHGVALVRLWPIK